MTTVLATPVIALPTGSTDGTCVLLTTGTMGLYMWLSSAWVFMLSEAAFSKAAIMGYSISIYVNPSVAPTLGLGSIVYRNGIVQGSPTIPSGTGIWLVTNGDRDSYIDADAGTVASPSVRFAHGQGFYTDTVSGGALALDLALSSGGADVLRLYSVGVLISGQIKVSGTIEAHSNFVFSP